MTVPLILGAMLLLGGGLGWLHPAGDSLAGFRGPGAVAVGLLAPVAFGTGARRV